MSENSFEPISKTNKDECYKESPQNFPLSQWLASSDSSPFPSWTQTVDLVQDYFGGLKEKSGHSFGEEVAYSVSTSVEDFEYSDFNYIDSNATFVIPHWVESSTEVKENLFSASDLKTDLESLPLLSVSRKSDKNQRCIDGKYDNIRFSKRLNSCFESLKTMERNSTEINLPSPFAEMTGEFLKPNINLCLTKFEQTCMRLIPLINRTNTQNYSILLVETLRTCSKEITLQEFYNLLCNSNTISSVESTILHGSKTYQDQDTSKLESLKVCSFILNIFKSKSEGVSSIVSEFVKNPLLETVNYKEMRKKFLAIKIIFDSVIIDEVSLRQKVIPRKSLYKVYSSICMQFPERFNKFSTNTKLNSSEFVGAAQFGHLTRLVYPNLKLRRLGRRGNSKHHYVGLIWNKSFVDDELLKKLPSDQPGIIVGDKDKNSKDISGPVRPRTSVLSKSDRFQEVKKSFSSGFADTKYSFVSSFTQLPKGQFSPRIWTHFPGKLPEQSNWGREIMEQSSMALQKYHVNMRPMIHDFHVDIFSGDDMKIFLRKFIQRIDILIENNSDDEGYFHLYLIILLLILPVILATDTEVPCENKVKLRKTLKDFVHCLDFGLANFPRSKLNSLQTFSNIIKKMINISDLSSSHIRTGLVQGIVQEIALDIQRPTSAHLNLCHTPGIEEIFSRAVFAAANAFESEFFVGNTQKNSSDNTDILANIVKAFVTCAGKTTEYLFGIPKLMTQQELGKSTFDLPFQIFKISTRVLHQFCFSDPFLSKLSIQAIGYILLLVNNELQNVSFCEFGNRESELSSGTFKTWWVYSTLSGEYMKILEEIVALGARLS